MYKEVNGFRWLPAEYTNILKLIVRDRKNKGFTASPRVLLQSFDALKKKKKKDCCFSRDLQFYLKLWGEKT